MIITADSVCRLSNIKLLLIKKEMVTAIKKKEKLSRILCHKETIFCKVSR